MCQSFFITSENDTLLNLKNKEQQPGEQEKKVLLRLARQAISHHFDIDFYLEKSEYSGWLGSESGAFVSIHSKKGELRGCLGRFESNLPLYKLIQELSVSAVSRDYRFSPVEKSELDNITIEISVLSSFTRIYSLNEIIPGKHGIYIKKGSRSGTFLPQVILDTNWDVETFVSRCSEHKARIGPEGWRDAELYIYTAEVFSE